MYAKDLFGCIKDMLSQSYEADDIANFAHDLEDLVTGYGLEEEFDGPNGPMYLTPTIRIGDVKETSIGLLLDYEHPDTGEILKDQKFMLSLKKYPTQKTYKQLVEEFYSLGGTREQVFQNMVAGGFHYNKEQLDYMKTVPGYEAKLDAVVAELTQAMFFYRD